jgi:hypothetical protein
MGVLLQWAFRTLAVSAIWALSLGVAGRASAGPISSPLTLSIDSTSISGAAGGTVLFTGTVTNQTGTDLNATDLFLNFSGFDPLSLESITQLLGSPDFTLSNMATSSSVDLFIVQIAQGTLPGSYPLDVSLQDINNNMSNGVLVSVNVASSTATAEPQVMSLLASGMVLVIILRRGALNRKSQERKTV